jgi:hypothetical protein
VQDQIINESEPRECCENKLDWARSHNTDRTEQIGVDPPAQAIGKVASSGLWRRVEWCRPWLPPATHRKSPCPQWQRAVAVTVYAEAVTAGRLEDGPHSVTPLEQAEAAVSMGEDDGMLSLTGCIGRAEVLVEE